MRYKLNELLGHEKQITRDNVLTWVTSLKTIIPGYISLEEDIVGLQGKPERVMEVLRAAIDKVPSELQQKYLSAFFKERP